MYVYIHVCVQIKTFKTVCASQSMWLLYLYLYQVIITGL